MQDYNTEIKSRRSRIRETDDLEQVNEYDLNANIKENQLCKAQGVNVSSEDFPVMKTFRKWRPYNFNSTISKNQIELPFKQVTVDSSIGYLYQYVTTVSNKGSQGFIMLDHVLYFKKTKDNDTFKYNLEYSKIFMNQFEEYMNRDTIRTIVIPIRFMDQTTTRVNDQESIIYALIYKNFKVIEFFHPELDDFFSSIDGEEVIQIFSNRPWTVLPLRQYNLQDYKIMTSSDQILSEITEEFLTFYSFMEENGYLRKSYKSFGYLWNLFILIVVRMQPGYTYEQMIDISSNFNQLSSRTRNKFYKQFYTFLQCFSSYIWNKLSNEEKDIVRS